MLSETKVLIQNFDRYFLRQTHWRYHILIVDNHLFDCYTFFLQAQRTGQKLVHSHDLLEIPHDNELYYEVLSDLKKHTQLNIEFRDTHHLVRPGATILNDNVHGHYANTSYHSHAKGKA